MNELGKTAYVILGMLKLGRRTGYEIKALVDVSTRFFWAASYGQIYPELARLEKQGLVKGEVDRTNGRRPKAYELTAAGERALHEWLTSDDPLHIELRHEGALKFFFSDALTPEEQLDQLRRIRRDARGPRGAAASDRAGERGRQAAGSPDDARVRHRIPGVPRGMVRRGRAPADPPDRRREELDMYKLIVRQIVRRTFARLSAGDYEAVVKQFGPRSRFVFSGDHALGGERHGQDAAREWFQEMLRLFPGIRIEPQTVVVNGWPWNTVVATHLDDQRNARRRAGVPQRGHAAAAPAVGPRGRGPDLRGHAEARRRAEAHAAGRRRAGRCPMSVLHRFIRWLGHRRWFAAAGRRFGAPLDRVLYRATRGQADVDGRCGAGDAAHHHRPPVRTAPHHACHVPARRPPVRGHERELRPAAACGVAAQPGRRSPRNGSGREPMSCRAAPGCSTTPRPTSTGRGWCEVWPAHESYRARSGQRHTFVLEPV